MKHDPDVVQDDLERQDDRERGVAMIMVLIFGVGALVLASTLLKISTLSITDSSERHNSKTLSAVLQAGISAAVFEINHDLRNGPYDPGGDGVGALGCAGAAPGVEVTVDGQSMGRYRTTIEKDGSNRLILTVVAVYPSFTDVRRSSAAQVILERGTPPFLADRNALSIVGPAGSGTGSSLDIRKSAKLVITDTGNSVPAVNIQDANTFGDTDNDGIPDGVAGPGDPLGYQIMQAATISGADKDNPGSGATGAGSMTNNDGGVLLSNDVTTIATNIKSYVNAQTPTDLLSAVTSNGGTVSGNDIDKGATLPNGVYDISGDVDLNDTVTGSGTLIIRTSGNKLELKKGELNWTGDVIVIGNDSEIEVENGTRMNVTGNLVVLTLGNDNAKLEVKSGGRLNVTGTLMDLNTGSDTGSDEGLKLDSGSRLNVDGLFLGLGTEVNINNQSGSRFNVTGSMVLAVPQDVADPDDYEFDMRMSGGSETNLYFNNGNFESALDVLGDFLKKSGADNSIPVTSDGYWEAGGASGLLTAQSARISGGSPLGYNQ